MSGSDSQARVKNAGIKLAHPPPGEEIVISGLSGQFPDSDDVYMFRDKLFNKVDLISDDGRRWKLDHPEIPQRTGKVNNISKFDASFFGVHYKQGHTMDPMCRKLLEKAYEAIVDAGINPENLRGSRCGVFVGTCFSESERTWFYEKIPINGYGISGCSRTMIPNKISYWLGLTGPSYVIDSACSSSMYALEQAYRSIREGECDMALVGSSNLCLHPFVSLQFFRLGVLSKDGSCKSFDESANGYCRSEALPMVFLQKAKDAHRVYATVIHCKTNCDGYKDLGITYPSGQRQHDLLKQFYEECGVDPTTVNFIEAHGTGTKVGDPEECNALDKIFCKGRKEPLMIGSIKSNIGHSEPASGLCSVTKAIIAMESGFIPPNLHFKTPREGIPAFQEGRLKVVTEKEPWTGGLIGINSFGFGGANGHVLLRWNEKKKVKGGAPNDSIPRLVAISGRTEEAVEYIIKDLESRPVDVEYVKLYHDIHSQDIPGHLYRGYVLLKGNGKNLKQVEHYSGVKKDLWFMFSGLGSQWPGMAKSLMKIPIFAAAIERCQNALNVFKGVNIQKILTESDSKNINNVQNSLIGITALQIGLVDILYSLGIYPQKIIGHSLGILACGYADGCLTAEQTILSAYNIGLAFLEGGLIKSSMFTIGMGFSDIQREIVPPEIDVVYHNDSGSCTLSGPTDILKKYVNQLAARRIPVKEINCFNIPLHSRHVRKIEKKLLESLKGVIPFPKPMTSKWVCSTSPMGPSDFPNAKMCSAEYITSNLLKPVLFEESCVLIPHNSAVVEISPGGYIKTVLQSSFKKDIVNVTLIKEKHDNTEFLLENIGKLFLLGFHPQLANLYPSVAYPLSRETPMISPLVKWNHDLEWHVTSFRSQEKIRSGGRNVIIDVKNESYLYVAGHVIDGRNLFPATGYLVLAWQTLAMIKSLPHYQMPIVFEKVRFNRATNLPKEGFIDFKIAFQKESGFFEIVEGGASIVTGYAYVPDDVDSEMLQLPEQKPSEGKDLINLGPRDIYKELRLRGYHYSGLFRGVTELDSLGKCGKITWANNYVAFMDNMLQTQILQEDTRSLYVPTGIQRLIINPVLHEKYVSKLTKENNTISVSIYRDLLVMKAGGIEIRELRASQIARKKPLGEPVLEKYLFVPHETHKETETLSLLETIRVCVHLVLENARTVKVKVVELAETDAEATETANHVASILGDLPLIQAEITILSSGNPDTSELAPGVTVENKKISNEQNCLVVIASHLVNNTELLEQAVKALQPGGFLILREEPNETLALENFNILVDRLVDNKRILLLQKKEAVKEKISLVPDVVKISEKDGFSWVEPLKEKMKNESIKSILLVAEKEITNGLLGLSNCLTKEPGGEKVRCVLVFDKNAPAFDLNNPFYASQLNKGLVTNIFKNGQWGTYRHQALPSNPTVAAEHVFINTHVRGDLSSLSMYEGPLNVNKYDGMDEIIIYYSSINFRDVMLASGKLAIDAACKGRINQEIPVGFEFSGKLASSGRRVTGMVTKGALASKLLLSDNLFVWDVPDEWSLEEAASVPVVYGTVFSALVSFGRIRKGESILIHSGTGGVGLAAINVSRYYECDIFVTVGTQEKRDYLKEHFPFIPESHIGNSRDTSFEDMIMRETKGKGVDLILNSLSEEKLQASTRCLAENGRFLEIGKFDMANDNPLRMEMFAGNKSYHGVHLDSVFNAPQEKKEELYKVLQIALDSKVAKPLKTTVFDYKDVEQAFRYMTTGKHIGKVLLKMRDEETDKSAIPSPKLFEAIPRFNCDHKKSYIIIGGLGGFGLELADWLVMRGAQNLVLTSRTGLRTGYQSLRVRLCRQYGAKVLISTQDITTEEGISNLLKEASAMGPVDSIFNLAAVLKDAIFENQTEETFATSFSGKAFATLHLDKLSRKLCPELKQFVIFSSVSCGRGNAGQTNYGMANSVMERVCEKRAQEGLPGLAIQWGAIGEVGLVAEMQEDHKELVIGGTLQQTIASCLKCLDVFLNQKNPIVASMVVAEKKMRGSGAGTIVDTVASILGIQDLKTISMHSSLAELGMDSMMAVEIKQTLEREFDVALTAQDIRGLTFAKLAAITSGDTGSDGKGGTKVIDIEMEKQMENLNMLFRLVADETNVSKPVVNLKTAEIDTTVSQKLKSLYGKPPSIFMIPGLEGAASVFDTLAEKIIHPALGLQFPYNNIEANSDMFEITRRMIKAMKPHMVPNAPFVLVGYSTGALTAVEMAFQLQEEGYKGKLILLDGAPEFLKQVTKVTIGSTGDSNFDTNLLHHMYNTVTAGFNVKVKEELNKLTTWDEKAEFMYGITPKGIGASKEHQMIMAKDLRYRLTSILKYNREDSKKLSVDITLVRPKDQVFPAVFPDDYNLFKICEKPVEVVFVEGNHLSMLETQKVADIINQTYSECDLILSPKTPSETERLSGKKETIKTR